MAVASLTNKAIEITTLLLSVFVITELSSVPAGCWNWDCLSLYGRIAPGNQEPDMFVRPCSQQRELCKYSFGNPWELDKAIKAGVVGPEILKTYNATIQFCKCMLIEHTGTVYCDLQGIRGGFFAISVLIVGLYEGSTAVKGMRSPAVRLAVSVVTILMYISIIVIMEWKGETCNSYMLYIDLRVIHSLSLASLVIIIIFTVVEAWVWIRALKLTRKERGERLLPEGGNTNGESIAAGGGTENGSEGDSTDEAARVSRSDGDEDEGDYVSIGEDDAAYLLFEDGGMDQATSI